MKKYLLIGLLPFLMTLNTINASTLDVMSWNVRRKGDDPIEHQWENRKSLIIEEITKKKPAIIGLQEVVLGQQLEDLQTALTDYKATGTDGRNSFAIGRYQKWVTGLEKAKNESNPIFYDPEQVTLLSTRTVALNPTGIFSHASLPRIFVVATFKDKQTGNTLHVYNTHLSSGSTWKFFKDGTNLIRTRQLKMILHDIKNTEKMYSTQDKLPAVIIMGDFNTKFEDKIKKKCTKAGIQHAKAVAKIIKGPEETRTGWEDRELKTIDHILVKNTKIEEFMVVKFPKNVYPSDHRPLYAKIILPQ